MSGLEIAASIVTVIGVGLRCSKFIYQVVSGIKGGPSAVQKLVKAVKDLANLLERIKELDEHAKDILDGKDAKFFHDFSPLLSECVDDLTAMKRKLERCTATSDRRFWHNLKTHLHEKELEKMWSRVDYYVHRLTSQLSGAGAALSLLNTGSLQLIGNAIFAASCDTKQRFDSLKMILGENAAQFNANRRENRLAFESQRDSAEDTADHHSRMLEEILSSLDRNNASDRKVRQALDKVSGQSDGLLDMSVAQFSEIQDLLATVQDLRLEVQGMRHDQAEWRHTKELEVERLDLCPAKEKIGDRKGYDESIIGLYKLAVGTERETSSREAQSIIQHLKKIIASLLNDTISPADTRYKSTMKRLEEAKDDKIKGHIERKDAIHRINDILCASRRLRLDRRGALEDLKLPSLAKQSDVSRRRCLLNDERTSDVGISRNSVIMYCPEGIRHIASVDRMADSLVPRKRLGKTFYLKENLNTVPKYQETLVALNELQGSVSSELEPFLAQSVIKRDLFSWQTAAGILDVQYNVQFSRHRNQPHDVDIEEQVPEEEFSARVVFTPASTPSPSFQLILNLSQKLTNENSILSTPVLSFRSIVPKSSDIFRIIQFGSVHDLEKAVTEGSASLTDCDSKGRSLLNVGTDDLDQSRERYLRADIMKYAMRALRPTMASFLIKVGADVNSYEVNHLGDMSLPFNWIFCNDREKSSRRRFLKTACLKILLSNDADPSLMVDIDDEDLVTAFYYEIECCSAAGLKAFLDLGSPFIGPNWTGVTQADPLKTYPLLVLSVMHRAGTAEAFETAEKIALLLSRGADVNQRDSSGNTCLHIVMDYSPLALQINNLKRQNELRDILMLMVTAGADVCAVNDEKQTAADIANKLFGHCKIWTEVLDTCGIETHGVRQAHKTEYGWSSAVDQSGRRSPAGPSKLSFPAYLQLRNYDARCRIVEDFEYSNAEEEHVHELGVDVSDYEDSDEESSDGEEGWDWNDYSDDDSGFDDDEQNRKEKRL